MMGVAKALTAAGGAFLERGTMTPSWCRVREPGLLRAYSTSQMRPLHRSCVSRNIMVRRGLSGDRQLRQRGAYWLDNDSVAFAVLVDGMGVIELLALSI